MLFPGCEQGWGPKKKKKKKKEKREKREKKKGQGENTKTKIQACRQPEPHVVNVCRVLPP
jgi:hypothetical protein